MAVSTAVAVVRLTFRVVLTVEVVVAFKLSPTKTKDNSNFHYKNLLKQYLYFNFALQLSRKWLCETVNSTQIFS